MNNLSDNDINLIAKMCEIVAQIVITKSDLLGLDKARKEERIELLNLRLKDYQRSMVDYYEYGLGE